MRERDRLLLALGLVILLTGTALGFVIDVDVTVESAVSWAGSVILGVTASQGEVLYFSNGAITGSCDDTSKIFDTNVSSGTINFTISELVEEGGDLMMEIGGVDHDISITQSSYSFPFTASGQKVCIKAIAQKTDKIKVTTSDITVEV